MGYVTRPHRPRRQPDRDAVLRAEQPGDPRGRCRGHEARLGEFLRPDRRAAQPSGRVISKMRRARRAMANRSTSRAGGVSTRRLGLGSMRQLRELLVKLPPPWGRKREAGGAAAVLGRLDPDPPAVGLDHPPATARPMPTPSASPLGGRPPEDPARVLGVTPTRRSYRTVTTHSSRSRRADRATRGGVPPRNLIALQTRFWSTRRSWRGSRVDLRQVAIDLERGTRLLERWRQVRRDAPASRQFEPDPLAPGGTTDAYSSAPSISSCARSVLSLAGEAERLRRGRLSATAPFEQGDEDGHAAERLAQVVGRDVRVVAQLGLDPARGPVASQMRKTTSPSPSLAIRHGRTYRACSRRPNGMS